MSLTPLRKLFLSALLFSSILFSAKFTFADLIIDAGEYYAKADITVTLTDAGNVSFTAFGNDQNATFLSQKDSGWECKDKTGWFRKTFSDNRDYVCSFSFVPKVSISEELAKTLSKGITIKEMNFKNDWTSSFGSRTYTVSWGYYKLYDVLSQLTADEDKDESGFWLKDASNKIIFRCSNDDFDYKYPCWHAVR